MLKCNSEAVGKERAGCGRPSCTAAFGRGNLPLSCQMVKHQQSTASFKLGGMPALRLDHRSAGVVSQRDLSSIKNIRFRPLDLLLLLAHPASRSTRESTDRACRLSRQLARPWVRKSLMRRSVTWERQVVPVRWQSEARQVQAVALPLP